MRAITCVLLLLAPTLAGCASDDAGGARLAQPTDDPPAPPTASTPRAPTVLYDFNDPGYRVDGVWRVGDGWDYESNQSHFRRVRVIDTRLSGGTTFYLIEERRGSVGMGASETIQSWVDGRGWALVNHTNTLGATDRYQPAAPVRYYRNGSFAYNHTRVESSGRVSVNESVVVQSRLDGTHQTLLFSWGYVEAKRVEQTIFSRDKGGNRTQSTIIHWVHRDYLNDVQFQLGSAELFKLTAAKAGNFRRGTLAT